MCIVISLRLVNDNREVATIFSQVRCDDIVVKLDRWLEYIYLANQFNNNRTSAWTPLFRAYHLSPPTIGFHTIKFQKSVTYSGALGRIQ